MTIITEPAYDDLRARLGRALDAVGAHVDSAPVHAAPVAAYREPHRAYHTLAHLEACLAWLDWCWALAERPHEIALALFFHDAVYDPLADDNEAKSAAWAEDVLARADVADDVRARITAMILATRAHDAREGDAALLVDIDLAILGASPRAFARFERGVREEYRVFDDATYAAGRARVLSSLRAKEPLYVTPGIADALAASARRNLDAAIAALSPT